LARRWEGDPEQAHAFLTRLPVVAPRALLEKGQLAQLCLRSVISGHRLRDESSRRQSHVMTLFEVSSDLAQAASEHELYALALNILGVLFDVECAALLLRDDADGVYRVHTAMGALEKALQPWTVPAHSAPLTERPAAGQVIQVLEAHELGKLGLPEEVERLTAVQLGTGGQKVGLLVLINAEMEEPALQMVRGFALQLSLVMEKQHLQAGIQEKVRELQVVQEASRQFLSCLEPEQLFEAVLGEARKITGARKGSLMLAGNGEGELAVKAVSGMTGNVVQKLRVRSGQGVAGRVFATGDPIVVRDIETDTRFGRKNRPRYATRSFLSLPISMDGRIVGVLNLSDKLDGEIFCEEDLHLLQTIATQATIAIERTNYYTQSQELRRISITDSLTGLLNRRYFQERLAEEVDRATRHGKPLSLMMIDVDHFKAFNDTHGHPAGDKILVMIARCLREGVRTIDVVSRFGGEEFAVILPETRKEEALEIGERLRLEVESVYFPGEETMPGSRLTVSLGVATFTEDARDLKGLIQKSDRALYQAKAQGRNRIVPYAPQRVVSEPLGAPPAPPAAPAAPAEEPPAAAVPQGWTRLL
jgi:diguanylate cyclase (GGDEF)-like protein